MLSTLDVVISLSETEGLPGVIIEAMANGRAIIANPVGGIPEMIGDNGAGYCIRHDDIDDAEHQIRKYMDDRTLLKKQGEIARKRAFELFDHRNHTQEIEELYMNLMMNRNKDCVGV